MIRYLAQLARNLTKLGRTLPGTCLAGCLLGLGLAGHVARAVEAPWIMYEDPALSKPAFQTVFPPGLVDLWLQALARPEREMKRRAALAIVDAAAKKAPGLDATVGALTGLLGPSEQDRIVRLTAARALVAIDARHAAPALIEAVGPDDLEMAEIVEPALARWKDTGLRSRWTERLGDNDSGRRLRVLAIRGLAALGAVDTLPRLRELALDGSVPTSVRLEAADALGTMQKTGLV
ncbi:MAG: HEAT repeat domain-containing protein, partial [Thermoguttaceae bacterium]